ncbi:hypothetical protein FGG08_005367 [Glutinoglossum americanum]|uniref:non-specific serine/threonine protein kinase n=1 Tax=Glutinoglossum americanum TaxID=1670608 RepID=A0A9P8L1H1_9PEZI|nr:hypothetical protein FGG08_005367 [Glutinoglossum americanum]
MGNSNGKPVVFTDEVNLNHFRLLRVVGKGAFGKVRIVERKDTGLTFALKYIRKDEGRALACFPLLEDSHVDYNFTVVVRSESVRNIIRERRMLEHLNHPFLCNLRYSFQDMEYLYIVVDLMNGGDLRFHISRKTFTEEAVRFWIAELGCALRYIHKQGIVHRDVKPDNVLLDAEGHVHLADFNVASDWSPEKPLTSKSGTLAYLAPEVYGGRGYGSEVDWWSLGVLFYECVYNTRPFEGNSHENLAKDIVKANPKYPITQPPVSMPCLHAISSLLEKDKRRRIGAAGFRTFTENPFFQPIDFALLEQKEIQPIFTPSSEKTNFDATYDLEELLLEEAPLEARARRQRPREQLKDDATEKEIREDELHRMIESLFEPFDYTAVSYDKYQGKVDEAGSYAGNAPDWAHSSSQSKSSTEESGTAVGSPTRYGRQTSPNGSPPLRTLNAVYPESQDKQLHSAPPPNNFQGRAFVSGGTRSPSMGGGVQMVLDETGSWSELANQSSSMGTDGKGDGKNKSHGMLGFLSRKRGRGSSPRPQEPGILGREGARVVIG